MPNQWRKFLKKPPLESSALGGFKMIVYSTSIYNYYLVCCVKTVGILYHWTVQWVFLYRWTVKKNAHLFTVHFQESNRHYGEWSKDQRSKSQTQCRFVSNRDRVSLSANLAKKKRKICSIETVKTISYSVSLVSSVSSVFSVISPLCCHKCFYLVIFAQNM